MFDSLFTPFNILNIAVMLGWLALMLSFRDARKGQPGARSLRGTLANASAVNIAIAGFCLTASLMSVDALIAGMVPSPYA